MPFAARCHSTHFLPTVWRRSLFLASFGPLSAAIQSIRALPLALTILRAYARIRKQAYTPNLLGWRVRYALGDVQLLINRIDQRTRRELPWLYRTRSPARSRTRHHTWTPPLIGWTASPTMSSSR